MTTQWRGRFLEDFEVGDVFRSRLGRTVTETDNTWFTCLTMNTNQMHFNREFAARTEFGQPLVVSTLTLAVVIGLSVADTSENAVANLGWGDIRLPKPVFAGDTLWAESEVTGVRPSRSRPSCGIVSIRTRGVNQRSEVVIEFTRSFMVFRSDAPEVTDTFPATTEPWTVGG
jgi:itaconyl-CoA hydratase